MRLPKTALLIALASALSIPTAARAQLEWRVSVKVLVDEDGDWYEDTCRDGPNHGNSCDRDVDCPGGLCLKQVVDCATGVCDEYVCSGGTNDGNDCDPNRQCPDCNPRDACPRGRCIGELNSPAEILAKIDAANTILTNNGHPDVPGTEERGYTVELVDIITIGTNGFPTPPDTIRACSNRPGNFCESGDDCDACVGGPDPGAYCTRDSHCQPGGTCTGTASCNQVSRWFDAPSAPMCGWPSTMQRRRNPTTWAWDHDAINWYVLGSASSGTAWRMVLLGQRLSSTNTPFHEIGHFLNLDHTHGGGGLSPACHVGYDDHVDDTLLDNCGEDCGYACCDSSWHPWSCGCWCPDQIADANFHLPYGSLEADEQYQVDQTYFNLMSYRIRVMLTPGQLDRMTDHSNGTVHHVTNGRTRFVDVHGGSAIQTGSSKGPFRTLIAGLSAADPGDIVLLRRGTYDEVMTIDQEVTLRASRGDALIGAAP